MASLRRAAKNSLRTIGNEAATEHRASEITQQTQPLRRAGLAMVDGLARRHPGFVAKALGIPWQSPELDVVDTGWQSTVYRLDEGTVVKVVESSMDMSRGERRRQADEMRDEHQAFASFVGPAVVPHEVSVGLHPSLHGDEVIRITQPYVNVEFLRLNVEPEEIPALGVHLRGVQATYPNVLDEIGAMLDGSRELYRARHMATDLIGRNNVGIETDTGSFVIIDGQPLTPANGKPQQDMGGYFDNLGAALELAA